jgi:hypothetical protein
MRRLLILEGPCHAKKKRYNLNLNHVKNLTVSVCGSDLDRAAGVVLLLNDGARFHELAIDDVEEFDGDVV